MNKKLIKELEWSIGAPGLRPAHRGKLQQALARARIEQEAHQKKQDSRRARWQW